MLQKVLSFAIKKRLHIQYVFYANNYLISGVNWTEGTAQYSINNEAGMLH